MTLPPIITSAFIRLIALCALCLSLAPSVISAAHAQSTRDQQVAAAMIYNFARFTRWPDGAFGQDTAFRICVDAEEALAPALTALEARKLKGRSIRIAQTNTGETPSDCHMRLIRSDMDTSTPSPNVLYVALEEGAAPTAAMLELVKVGRQTRFVANPSLARKTGLQLSSKLIDLAIQVK